MVFYRKYRPQLIDDLDNAEIRTALQAIFGKKDSIPHAFLFTGPKGLGKTSTARIIAKVVNCEKRNQELGIRNHGDKLKKNSESDSSFLIHNSNEIEPCNECEQCRSIMNGTNLDVLEIDAASNRGIDEIRELKEKIRLAPLAAKRKVYIIDEVHMLTTEAFNALLKTLEEPPDHAMFILCTTESHKIPSTILSRCFHLSFHLATEEELVRSFGRIAKGEQIEIDTESLRLIAQLAEGGFRDGVKILEEIVSLSNGASITKAFVEEKYQVSSIKNHVDSLLDSLQNKDTKKGLQIIATVVSQGVDMKYFVQELMEELHRKLLMQTGITPEKEEKEVFSLGEIRNIFDLLAKAYADMKYSVLPQLPLELATIEYTHVPVKKTKREEQDAQLEQPAQEENGEVTVSTLRKQVGTIKKIQALYGEPKKEATNTESTVEISKVELLHAPADGVYSKEWMDALWRNIILEMKQHNHTVAGVLRGCSIKSYDKNSLIILASYKFHKERLDEMKNRMALVKVCKLLTGNDVAVEVELKK